MERMLPEGFHPTHPGHLERWLGADQVARLSGYMQRFPWPVPVAGVPGNVFAMPGGDFNGQVLAGSQASAQERARDIMRKARRNRFFRSGLSRRQAGSFGSLSAVVAAYTGGKGQPLFFSKVGSAVSAVAGAEDLFYVGNLPSAGGAGAATPGGTAPTSSTTGALKFANPTNANTTHCIGAYITAGVAGNTLLLCDRLFSVLKTASSSSTEAVTGTFSRYQNTTSGAEDYIGGNFCFPSISGTIANTAHNWTVCQYTNQAGSTGQSFPSIAGIAASTNVNLIDLAVSNWFMPMASGDVGVKALTQLQCSSASITGSVNFNVVHPICFMPAPVANMVCIIDGINSAFNFVRIYDNACLQFIEMPKPATTATTYSGMISVCAE